MDCKEEFQPEEEGPEGDHTQTDPLVAPTALPGQTALLGWIARRDRTVPPGPTKVQAPKGRRLVLVLVRRGSLVRIICPGSLAQEVRCCRVPQIRLTEEGGAVLLFALPTVVVILLSCLRRSEIRSVPGKIL